MSLIKRDASVIWHPYTQMLTESAPIGIVRGEGVWLTDENGNQYIDAISSWWVNIHGHAHPHIAFEVSKQLYQLEQVIFSGFTHEPAVRLAERLLKLLPSGQEKVFYSDNGSTAVEVAIKMAIQYWHNQGQHRHKVIVLEHSYHGDTFGAMSTSARSIFTLPFADLLFEVLVVPFPQQGKEEKTAEVMETLIREQGNSIAAFLFEPLVLGAGGMQMYAPGVLDQLICICKKAGILTIADEVMTGFGRTGKLFACNYLSQEPDLICLSKAITGGFMAMGATTCTHGIYTAFLSDDRNKTFFHGHSYTGNPLACAAANASLDLLLKEECQFSIQRIADQHQYFAGKLCQYHAITSVRYLGTILAFDFRTEKGYDYLNPIRDELLAFFLHEKVLLRPLGNTVYIMPPYCISEEELNSIYRVVEKAVKIITLRNVIKPNA